MKSQYELLSVYLAECQVLGLGVSSRDIVEVAKRIEGDSTFPEILLPTLDAALLGGLSTGRLEPIPGFKPKRGSALPEFLYGIWSRIFHADATLLSDPDHQAIRTLRQISRLYAKVFEVCSDDKVEAAYKGFVETDRALSAVGDLPDDLPTIFSRLFGPLLSRLYYSSRVGRHGPGATAERLDSVGRWDFSHVEPRLIERYGEDFFYASRSEYLTRYPLPDEQYGRVVPVPKNRTRPRLISIEPSAHQYAQQALMSRLYNELSTYPVTNIRDQSRNGGLAKEGSRSGNLATLDLSEASDRLSMRLLKHTLANHEWFADELEDLRTRGVMVPGYGLVPLNKYASMGSALTFPIQVMVFTSIAVLGLVDSGVIALSDVGPKTLRRADLGVYGDDIIVPTDSALIVIERLERCGLVVNRSKSFYSGLFRESCGSDYYAGTDVKPVYCRRNRPLSRRHVSEIIAYASLAWSFKDRGFLSTANFLSSVVSSIVGDCRGDEPTPLDSLERFGEEWHQIGKGAISVPYGDYPQVRFNSHLQVHQYRYPTARVKRKTVECTDRALLAAALAAIKGPYTGLRGGVPEADPKALTHDGRPVGAFISYRWMS